MFLLARSLDHLLLAGIAVYQRHISPRKGYRCAYSLVYGGTGCSGYVKQVLQTEGLFAGWSKITQRFHDCQDASLHLQTLDCGGCDAGGCDGGLDLPGCGGGKAAPSSSCPSGGCPADLCASALFSGPSGKKIRMKQKNEETDQNDDQKARDMSI